MTKCGDALSPVGIKHYCRLELLFLVNSAYNRSTWGHVFPLQNILLEADEQSEWVDQIGMTSSWRMRLKLVNAIAKLSKTCYSNTMPSWAMINSRMECWYRNIWLHLMKLTVLSGLVSGRRHWVGMSRDSGPESWKAINTAKHHISKIHLYVGFA